MDVYDTIRTALAVRNYQDKPVPPQITRRVVEAGRLTGSGSNRQPWQFIVVEDRDMLRKLGAAGPTGSYIAQAPLAIVVAIEDSPLAVSDASRAIQSMILAAWSEGIGSNWVGFHGLDDVQALLNIPDRLRVFAILPMGYPLQSIGKGKKKRKSLSEVAHREKFGQPFNE